MELKDYLFYGLSLVVLPWAFKIGINLYGYSQMLRDEKPECYQTNENYWQLFVGTWAVLLITMHPVQALAYPFFQRTLPSEKFPHGSKAREIKAQISSERLFRCLVYCATSGLLLWSLR